jgi:hypothetical protein
MTEKDLRENAFTISKFSSPLLQFGVSEKVALNRAAINGNAGLRLLIARNTVGPQ